MSDNELLSPDNSGSGWDNVLLAYKIDKWGGGDCNKNVLVRIFCKISSQGASIPDWKVCAIALLFSHIAISKSCILSSIYYNIQLCLRSEVDEIYENI